MTQSHSAPSPASSPTSVAIILASVRSHRVGVPVTNWVLDAWKTRNDLRVEVVDLAEFDLPADLDRSQPDAKRFASHIDGADAVVIVTPEYNHSYPGQLKVALDVLGPELQGKPVAFVAYGGISGGLRSVEHLRPVLAELNAVTIRNTVSLPYVHARLDASGTFVAGNAAGKALGVLAEQLLWWAIALRNARATQQYVA